MKSSETKYGLYHIEKQKILGYESSSNEGAEFCNEDTYTLSHYSDRRWLVDDPRNAEWVRVFNVSWYNSSYEYPMCDYKSFELKVIKLEIEITITDVDINIPTIFEFYEKKYKEKDPKYWNYIKDSIDQISPYYVYELDQI